jgi:hypothetical protein
VFEHKKYCIHYRLLKYVVKELGVVITKIHNVVEFKKRAGWSRTSRETTN